MKRALRWPILGVLAAIAVTTAMDAGGLANFSALALVPLMGLFWYLERLPLRSVGFVWGRWSHYGLALLYPLLVLGLLTAIAAAAGAVDVSQTDWKKVWINCALISAGTFLAAIVTEEGFFRGWLWASLERAGESPRRVLVWSSVAFSLWHVSAVTLETGFELPPAQIPVYLINVVFLGMAWGLMRWVSGSLIVTSLSHGVWNGIAYSLFGFGTRVGALGIENTALYGPEVGLLGLALNALCVAALLKFGKILAPFLVSRDRGA